MTLHIKRRNKYGNIKVNFRGITFDSGDEKRRYQELLLLEIAGEISSLSIQPRYLLQPSFRNRQGKHIRAMHCTWDFLYIENDCSVAEDVKSPPTRKEQAYGMRKKLFMKRYPEIEFREVV